MSSKGTVLSVSYVLEAKNKSSQRNLITAFVVTNDIYSDKVFRRYIHFKVELVPWYMDTEYFLIRTYAWKITTSNYELLCNI